MALESDAPSLTDGERRSDREHHSIGEVLTLLKTEFPDITISKIRFLESQGLLEPERTSSGYRKFFDDDIGRLRWILRQQREHFLPLKVIKGRLDDSGGVTPTDDGPADATSAPAPTSVDTPDSPSASGASSASGDADPAAERTGDDDDAGTDSAAAGGGASAGDPQAVAEPSTVDGPPQPLPTPSIFRRAVDDRPTADPHRDPSSTLSSVSMTVDELAAASGLSTDTIAELERYGLLVSTTVGSTPIFDDDALAIARLANGFVARGIEPRHLRMYKVAAEREAGVFEQLVMPLVQKRTPESRTQAIDLVRELSMLGDGLREAMLRSTLRDLQP